MALPHRLAPIGLTGSHLHGHMEIGQSMRREWGSGNKGVGKTLGLVGATNRPAPAPSRVLSLCLRALESLGASRANGAPRRGPPVAGGAPPVAGPWPTVVAGLGGHLASQRPSPDHREFKRVSIGCQFRRRPTLALAMGSRRWTLPVNYPGWSGPSGRGLPAPIDPFPS